MLALTGVVSSSGYTLPVVKTLVSEGNIITRLSVNVIALRDLSDFYWAQSDVCK